MKIYVIYRIFFPVNSVSVHVSMYNYKILVAMFFIECKSMVFFLNSVSRSAKLNVFEEIQQD